MMHAFSFLLLTLALAGVGFCDDLFGLRLTTEKIKTREDTQYFYRYYVQDDITGDFKTQEETKQGDSVKGSYTVAEPNGDLRKVTYRAGPGRGFEAIVDVQPTKETSVDSTPVKGKLNVSEEPQVLKSNVKHIPGGFVMDISGGEGDEKAKMKMEFVLRPNNATVQPTSGEVVPENVGVSGVENQTHPLESRETTEDPVEAKINEAINSLPKIIPDFILPDNKTHLKFHKDPEEALLDERISQIARQLAETDLRKEYEKQKLGHYIPISVAPVGLSTPAYLSKSFKFTGNEVPESKPSIASPTALTQGKVSTQYKDTAFSKLFPSCQRLPSPSKPVTKSLGNTKTILAENHKTVDPTNQPKMDIATLHEEKTHTTPDRELMGPVQIPPILRFFSPSQKYLMYTEKSFGTEKSPELIIKPLVFDLTTGTMPANDETLYAAIPIKSYYSTEKS